MVCLITHHIPELLFFQAWNGSTFDSIAVYSTWCSVIPKTWTADVIFPRNALPIELAKRKRLGFSRVIDCMQSFAEVWTVCEKNTGENTQLMWCKSSSFNGIVVSPCVWWKFLLMTFEFTFHCPILLTTIKKGSFCCCETWNYCTSCKSQEVGFILHVKLYWKSSIDEHWLSAQRSNVIL